MKKLFYILLLALPLGATAQKELQGFWGLDFHMSPDVVTETIKARTGKLPEEGSSASILGYKNCDFGGNRAYLVQLAFSNNKLYGGDIIIAPAKEDLLTTYNKIVSDISSKYHLPEKENNVMGTGEIIYALWDFPPGKAQPNGRITTTIENDIIKISYRDGLVYNRLITSIETNGYADY